MSSLVFKFQKKPLARTQRDRLEQSFLLSPFLSLKRRGSGWRGLVGIEGAGLLEHILFIPAPTTPVGLPFARGGDTSLSNGSQVPWTDQ